MIIVVDVHDCFDDDVCLWVDDYDLMIMVMISTWCYMMMFMSMIKMLWLKGYMIMLMTNICRYVMIFIWWYNMKYMTNVGRIMILVKEV
jgi:hypothetical protein